MKSVIPHFAGAVAAAVTGWFAGGHSTDSAHQGTGTAASSRVTAGVNQGLMATGAWEAEISSVRAVPGAASETAWIKWAMQIADADIPAAIASLNSLTDFHALRLLYSRWVKLDPEAAWASFRQSKIPAQSTKFYLPDVREGQGSLGSGLVADNPRSLIAGRMLHSWMATDSAACLAFVSKLEDRKNAEAKEQGISPYMLNQIKELNQEDKEGPLTSKLAEAAKQAAGLEGGRADTEKLTGALWKWLKLDPRAACSWIKELPSETRKALNFGNLGYYMSSAPAKLRMETTMSLMEGRASVSAYDMNVVLRSLDQSSYDSERGGIVMAAKSIREWTGEDPVAARAYVNALPAGNLRTLLTGQLAGELVKTDANAAIALVNQVEGEQHYALTGLVNGWVQQDSAACLAWLGKINAPEFTNTSYATVAERLSTAQPMVAVETALKITDLTTRNHSLEQIKSNLNWNPALVNRLAEVHPELGWK